MNVVENAVDSSWAQPGVHAHVVGFAAAPQRVEVARVTEHFVVLDNGWKFPRGTMKVSASENSSSLRDVSLVPVPDYAAAVQTELAGLRRALKAVSEEALNYDALVEDPSDSAFDRNLFDMPEDLLSKVEAASEAHRRVRAAQDVLRREVAARS